MFLILCISIGLNAEVYFKAPEVQQEFYQAPLMLQVMGCDFSAQANRLGIEPVMTRVTAKVHGSSGVHEAGRALDFRGQYKGEHQHSLDERLALVHYINAKYKRRDNKKSIIYHRFDKGSPYHYHLQIPKHVTSLKGGN